LRICGGKKGGGSLRKEDGKYSLLEEKGNGLGINIK